MLKRSRDRRRDIVSECTRIIDNVLIGAGKLSPRKKKLGRVLSIGLPFLFGLLLGIGVTLLFFV